MTASGHHQRLRGAYYGLLRTGETSPFLDLRPLLAPPRWFHALEVLRETGSALPMAAALDDGRQNQSARTIGRELSQIAKGYLSGLPLELGQQVRQFCQQRLKPLKKLLERDHHLPPGDRLAQETSVSPHELEPGAGRLGDRVGVPEGRVTPAFDVGEHSAHSLLEGDPRLPAEVAADLRDVGPRAVRLAGPFWHVERTSAS